MVKVILANHALGKIKRRHCSVTCPAGDISGHGPPACTCGAEAFNKQLDEVGNQLKL